MAILCRRADEEYDDDAIPAKTEKFKELSYGFRLGVQFFFDNAKRKINSDFPNVLGKTEEEVEEAKVEFLQLDSTISS